MNKLNLIGLKSVRRKTLLMMVMLLCVGTAEAQVLVRGSVFGGGKGYLEDEKAGHVTGNTTITMAGGTVERSVYGGGEQGSVGTFTTTTITYPEGDPHAGTQVVVPTECTSGGLATVRISGGTVGVANQALMPAPGTPLLGDDFGYVFCGGRGEVDTTTYPKAIALGVVGSTSLYISGTALITASAYGGCENGMVLGNTTINMSGGQIGVGHYKDGGIHHFDGLYTDEQWAGAITAVNNATIGTTYDNPFHECDSWPYGDANGNHYVYDVFADPTNPLYEAYAAYALTQGASVNACDGHSFFGNLFGGGSGYYPYAAGKWRRSAGVVKGNVTINLSGGHVLTNLYAGNETTDILGKCTVNMSGGTIGVPRTLDSINKHPVTCYLFGGGMGDPRTYFNKWTNVSESEINLTGGTIFGSLFGGGEEGHVLGNVTITVNEEDGNTLIGTLGYSYVDGNIFGAGRGLSGMALTAGSVGGNIEINIEAGKMLGSVYGGGRLASVGTYFVPPTDPHYGQLQEGDDHGVVTINISGGTIGNDNATDNALYHPHGGNVFGGSMGRLKDINNTNYLPLWHRLARVKETHVNITGGTIKNIVYGGSEYGSVRDSAIVVVNHEDLYIRKVYGGGYGSDVINAGYVSDSTAYPALLAGRVEGNTLVKVMAGTIGTNVYGGGDLATVGIVKNGVLLKGNTNVVISGGNIGNASNYATTNPSNIDIGHVYGGGQGIQYNFENYKAYCNVNATNVTIKGGNVYGSVFGGGPDSHVLGNTSVTLQTGARIGTSGTTEWDGDVFGGGKGNTSSLTAGRVGGNTSINMENGILMGNIYGGGRFGQTGVDVDGAMQTGDHGNTKVMVKGGTVGNSAEIEEFTTFSMGNIYGGGKGYLNTNSPSSNSAEKALLLGLTKNTTIEISDTLSKNTRVYGIVLGGGELASVGHYNLTKSGNTITSIAVTEGTGTTKVRISGGIIGGDRMRMRANTNSGSPWLIYNDDLGYVYGGGEGYSDAPSAYPTVQESATSSMSLLDLIATVQSTEVTITNDTTISNAVSRPWVKASVFGGSESGHVRGNTKVTIAGGTIGAGDSGTADVRYDDTDFANPTSTTWYATAHWPYESPYTPFDPALLSQGRTPKDGRSWFGNVFGGGSGWFPYVTGSGTTENPYVSHWNANSGKVWGNTEVNIEGGHILNNVYGANESTDVGDFGIADAAYTAAHPEIHVGDLYCKNGGKATVKMSGGTVGVPLSVSDIKDRPLHSNVFGGGAGDPRRIFNVHTNVDTTDVQITGGIIYGSVFGGAEQGHVVRGTLVSISEAAGKTITIGTTGFSGYDGNVFGGGKGDDTNYDPYPAVDATSTTPAILAHRNFDCGRVGGNTKVAMSKGTVLGNLYGGGMIGLTGVGMKGVENYSENGFWSFISGTPGNYVYDSIHHGTTTVEVTGGIIGNYANSGLDLLQSSEKVGNVYGGGRGDINEFREDDLGRAANAVVTISNSPTIYGSVFGGGQMANIGHWNNYDTWYTTNTGTTKVTITGNPTIGTEKEFKDHDYATIFPSNTVFDTISGVRRIYHSYTGNVFGGGEGNINIDNNGFIVGTEQGHCHTTIVKIGGAPTIRGSVFGGSEEGAVWGDTYVAISGGTIGTTDIIADSLNTANVWIQAKNKYYFGNVFGGSYGADCWKSLNITHPTDHQLDSVNYLSGHVYGNATVVITGGTIRGNVFGGGNMACLGDTILDVHNPPTDLIPRPNTGHAKVSVSGTAIIGPLDGTGLNAYVFGGGKGIGNDPNVLRKKYCNVNSTEVTIDLTFANPTSGWNGNTDGRVYGSLFGGGSDCHVLDSVSVTLKGGLIGTNGTTSWDGNIFGGGRNFQHTNTTAGRVAGNITVNMEGGVIQGTIFGGGRLGITGIDVNGSLITTNPDDHGNVTINVSGGTVGNESLVTTFDTYSMGDVFGGGKGIQSVTNPGVNAYDLARVKNTEVNISSSAKVLGSVYGGGEMANVGWYTLDGSGHYVTVENTGLAQIEVSGGQVGMEQAGQETVKGGNVFGGGLGLAGGKAAMPFANVDTTSVKISNSAYIVNSVFGGADNGHVIGSTYIEMTGGTVGKRNTLAELTVDQNEQPTTHIYTGSVIAGGRGVTPVSTSPLLYNDTTGIVFGNATVKVTAGVVRHGVYGGGGLSHVGTIVSKNSSNVPTFKDNTGLCTVIVEGGHFGPTKADLESYTETDKYNTFFNNLGGNAGWVFGAGCGLAGKPDLTFCDSTIVSISGASTQIVGSVFGGGENGHVTNGTNVTVSNGTIGGIPLHGTGQMTVNGTGAFTGISFTASADELEEDIYGGGRRVFRGNVYGGGKGNDFIPGSSPSRYSATSGRVYGNTKVTISGSATIYNRVFGGGSMASVGDYNYHNVHTDSIVSLKSGGKAIVIISGGTIGTDGNNNGDVFGGGRGLVGRHWEPTYTTGDQVVNLAYVGKTDVTINDGAVIKSNVYGGSANGHVQEDTHVTVNGGTIGYTYTEGGLTKVHGGWHSNVYGGGGGHHRYQKANGTYHHSITSGRVYGNTTVEIKGGTVMHNVYGGGAIASVGTYNIYDPANYVVDGTGEATVTITGGTIGYDGNNNGMVYGSGRGQIDPIDAFMDSLSYVVKTVVNIGKETSPGVYSGTAMVHGSVYGSGENGHTYEKATVNVYSGTIGCEHYEAAHDSFFANHGNVYGAGCGTDLIDESNPTSYNPRSGMVWGNTEVNVYGGHISHNVYGGGAMALVGTYTTAGQHWTGGITDIAPRTGKTVVNIMGGTIGLSDAPAGESGNVYGASRGPLSDNGFTDKAIVDTSYVFISGTANVLGSVYGGGEKSWVRTARVATVSGGTVEGNVYGGGKNGIDNSTPFVSLKTVNVRGGHIKGNVFGGSYLAKEKTAPDTWANGYNYWSSFVNITGGTIDQNVYAAGYGGSVDGSVCVNVGLTAVENAPTYINSLATPLVQANIFDTVGVGNNLSPDILNIGGSIFDGSYQYEATPGVNWLYEYDITGHSAMYIDGNGYNTTSTTPTATNYMNIGGGIYGGGNYCESGAMSRKVLIKDYGTRVNNPDGSLRSVTRTLTTLQRAGLAVIDHSNIHFTGEADLSQTYLDRDCFGILTVDDGLYVANGSSFVLGTTSRPAYMDSIKEIRSLHLKTGTSYQQINASSNTNWEWIGVNYSGTNTPENAHLYYTETNNTTALTYAQENVIVFNGDSRMWVRYKNASTNGKVMYGPIYGFFRVRADEFTPQGTKSFAYARPKLTDKVNPLSNPEHPDPNDPNHYYPNQNEGDGGFLSYNSTYNDFTKEGQIILQFRYTTEGNDGGDDFTKTKQYPYYNFSEVTAKGNMEEYREWVLPVVEGHIWYVDGRGIGHGGWGQDKSHEYGWGDYPDKPKLTITGNDNGQYGIFYDPKPSLINQYPFNPEKDIIFVVGPVQALLEQENLNQSATHPLKLYRYPGGHKLSNTQTDAGGGVAPTDPSYNGVTSGTAGPGANLDAMVYVNKTTSFVMENVMVDGLFKEGNFTPEEILMYTIPSSYNTNKLNVSEPLVVTASGAQLTLKGGTQLQHGYNNTDASTTWFHNADYTPETNVHHGALYVDANATVNVEGLVTIEGNLQKNGSGTTECNVYLPTFDKYINITGPLTATTTARTEIGITSPIRKRETNYADNTLSPVAIATPSANAADTAAAAWRHCNFYDDQGWFFVNGNTADSPRTTYYSPVSSKTVPNALYFGWTWANAVRQKPAGYTVSTTPDEKRISISSAEGLAWLISRANGENGETASNFADTTIVLNPATDIDLQAYIWVPVSSESQAFSGTFDGQGHLIKNLTIDYLGAGSGQYEYTNFGLFGTVDNGSLDRTFVVGGRIQPLGNVTIGGLAAVMQGNSVISNSEAALDIRIPNMTGAAQNASGGLVGLFLNGEIHSSMAMPTFNVGNYYTVGGLVGYIGTDSGSETPKLNNSFAYPKFIITESTASVTGGGLVGINDATGAVMNCYARLQASTNLTTSNYGSLVYNSQGAVDNCFGFKDDKDGDDVYSLAGDPTSSTPTNSYYFSAVESSDTYGYLYTDNQLYDWDGSNWTKADTCLFVRLNRNITSTSVLNDNAFKYARWARPTLPDINGDYPVLLLGNYDDSDKIGQGGFRSMATCSGNSALQYGGTVRDATQLSTMLARTECVYVYGDVTEDLTSAIVNASKVVLHEDAAIIMPGALSNLANTYVGVSFDNSARQTFDVNGLARDWHMLSSPLQDAPLGINYVRNEVNENDGINDPSYNPYASTGDELPEYPFYAATVQDGYFPYYTPYAEYDFYCFNEYTKYNSGTTGSPHWINFKRNGNSHHFSQGWAPFYNGQIDYYPYEADPMPAVNVNESTLVQGKGYLMALQEYTYLQAHGHLNGSDVTINISNKATHVTSGGQAQNLVGNPFHAYLDFDKFAQSDGSWASPNEGLTGNAYYVYDADHRDYISYTAGGSVNGDYADQYIHPHQGFFVKSTASTNTSHTITFTPEMLVTRNEAGDVHFRNDERPAYPLVNLYAEDGEGRNEVVVIEFNRPDNGGGLKVNGLRSGNHLMYAHNGDNDYCAFFAKEGTDKVPVRFKTYEDGIFTMHWNTANGNFQSLYLIDNITGQTCDMLRNDSYTFNALESDYLSRFYIVFDVTDVEENNENHIFAYFDGNDWVVNGQGHFDLIDMTGRVLYSTEFHNEQNRVNLNHYAKGMYFMRLSGYHTTITQKIVHIK